MAAQQASWSDDHTAAVEAAVARFTVRPHRDAPADPQHVVVTLLDGDLDEAFATARVVAQAKGSVRLVGHGATLEATWPSWVRRQPGLVLTELGAYRAGNILDATADLRARYRDWIEKVFAPAAPAGTAADVYYAPAVLRLFHAVFESQVFVRGILALHPNATFHLVGQERRAFEAAQQAFAGGGRRRDVAMGPALVAAWLSACAFTLVECVRMRLAARRSFDRIDELARRETGRDEPSIWLGLVPDWYRMNKHLLDAGALPELEVGRRVGVILLGTLRAGMRDEVKLKEAVDTDKLWPGLDWLNGQLDRCVVEQAVQPRSPRAFAEAVGAFVRSSASVAMAMARNPEPLHAIAQSLGTLTVARRAATAATLDVARSILAERAARELVSAHRLGGKVVAFAAANAAGFTSVEGVLRGAGAITVEHTHGSGGSAWYGGNESSAWYQCIWTHAEEQLLGKTRRCIVAGMPQTLTLRPRAPRVPRRVLILSNYVHRDRPYRAMPHEPFQTELLRVATLLRERFGEDAFEFRWRPHPADEPDAVERGHARVPFVTVSRGRTLAEDLDDCDVLVSGQSTALVEAIVGGVPFFVQVIPELINELSWVPRERRFFTAEELIDPFVEWVDAIRRGDPSASEPENRARRALFGPSGRPRSLHEGLVGLPERPSAGVLS